MKSLIQGALVAVACWLSVGEAQADPRVDAQQLFDQGRLRMKQGKLAEACAKFAASHELDPNGATLMNLGACQQASRKLASAWGTFRTAASLPGVSAELKAASLAKADQLERRLSSLEIVVPVASRIPGLAITRNGVRVLEAQWNSAIYVDGGEHELVARAGDRVTWSVKLSINNEADWQRVEVPMLESVLTAKLATPSFDAMATAARGSAAAAGSGSEPGPESGSEPGSESDPGSEPEPEPGSGSGSESGSEPGVRGAPGAFTGLRKLSLGVGILGVATVATGAYFGVRARDDQAASDAICPTTACSDPHALALNADARAAGRKANLLMIAGGAAVAAGVVLWIVGGPDAGRAPDARGVALVPVVSPERAGVALSGAF